MKKKVQLIAQPVIAEEIRTMARKSVEVDRPVTKKDCVVCGTAYTPATGPRVTDDLCWVCRRLKISAWRDSDQQVALQE